MDVNTVGELIDWLATQPRYRIVVMSERGGNGFSPLADVGEAMYLAESTWEGAIFPTPEDIASDDRYTAEDGAPDGAIRVVVLGPTN